MFPVLLGDATSRFRKSGPDIAVEQFPSEPFACMYKLWFQEPIRITANVLEVRDLPDQVVQLSCTAQGLKAS